VLYSDLLTTSGSCGQCERSAPANIQADLDGSSEWLFIGTGPSSVAISIKGSNSEFGAITSTVPDNGNSGGPLFYPDLSFGSNVPNVPGINLATPAFGFDGKLPPPKKRSLMMATWHLPIQAVNSTCRT